MKKKIMEKIYKIIDSFCLPLFFFIFPPKIRKILIKYLLISLNIKNKSKGQNSK